MKKEITESVASQETASPHSQGLAQGESSSREQSLQTSEQQPFPLKKGSVVGILEIAVQILENARLRCEEIERSRQQGEHPHYDS